LNPDGAIVGLPETYLPAQFLLKRDDKGRAIHASLRLTSGHYEFPECILRVFDKNPRSKIGLISSWYHEESLLPYYISLKVAGEEKTAARESFSLLFNLRTAEPLEVTRWVTWPTKNGARATEENFFDRLCPGKKMTDGWRSTQSAK
jgi:hypothetical protein